MMNRRSFLQFAAAVSAAIAAPLALAKPAPAVVSPRQPPSAPKYRTMVRLCAWGKSTGDVRQCVLSVNSRDHGVTMLKVGVSSHGSIDLIFPFDSRPTFVGGDEPVVTLDDDGVQYGFILSDEAGGLTVVTGEFYES